MKDNVLTAPIIRIRGAGGVQVVSLPGVLAALARDAVEDFPALRPHQQHPWHAFLCQLTVMALEQAGETSLGLQAEAGNEAKWRELLRGLTKDFPDDEPWRLVVKHLAQPAFLQPPVPENSLADFTSMKVADQGSPLSLDVLVVSKAHGVKAKAPMAPRLEDWMFGLLMLQTFSGFLGVGNYGIARQNKGFGARHSVSLTFSSRPGRNWQRDCAILLAALCDLRDGDMYPQEGGEQLLWLVPWKGEKTESLPLRRLHPLFIEVCRRIRLQEQEHGKLQFLAKATQAERVASKEFHGAVRDPWLPVCLDKKGAKAFNSQPTYSVCSSVMFDRAEWVQALLQRFHASDSARGALMLFRSFMRSRGGTDGYHERRIPIPGKALGLMRQSPDLVATVASQMIEAAKAASFRVLKPALFFLLQAAKKEPEFKQPETSAWAGRVLDGLDRDLDQQFFPKLWACLDVWTENQMYSGCETSDLPDGEAGRDTLKPWRDYVLVSVRKCFQEASQGLPLSSSLRYRALAKAENHLERGIRKNLLLVKE